VQLALEVTFGENERFVVRVFLGKKLNLSLNGSAYYLVFGYVHASHRTPGASPAAVSRAAGGCMPWLGATRAHEAQIGTDR